MAPEPNPSGLIADGGKESGAGSDLETTRGPQIISISVADDPGAWSAVGFAVDRDGICKLGSVSIRLTGGSGGDGLGGFASWGFDGLRSEISDIDGLAVAARDAEAMEASGRSAAPDDAGRTVHPNGITSIDHLVISSDDCDRTTAALEAAGFPKRRGRAMTSKGSQMAQGFFWAGDVILELVGPDSAAGSASGTDIGPTRPAELFGLALVSPDLDATARFLGELMGQPKEAVQAGRRIAGLRGRSVGISVPIAVMSPHRPEHPA